MLTAIACLSLWSSAAEIVIRRESRVESAVVTLADVAQIAAGDASEAARLERIELGLAPVSGRRRTLSLREVQDALALAGENLARHQFTGASQIDVLGPLPPRAEVEPVSRPQPRKPAANLRPVERALTDAIVKHLREATGQRHGWSARLAADEAALLALDAADSFRVEGGAPPYGGAQTFRVVALTAEGPQELRIPADIERAPGCVVLKRALNRGTLLGPGDVEVAVPPDGSVKPNDAVFDDPELVYGREITQTLQAGAVIKASVLQAPILVKRGQAVTVYSRATGVTVRTTARAKDEGSLNSLIAVETIDTKQSFFARVRGPQEVEIMAQATRTAPHAVGRTEPHRPPPAPAPVEVAVAPARRSSWLAPQGKADHGAAPAAVPEAAPRGGHSWRPRPASTGGETQ